MLDGATVVSVDFGLAPGAVLETAALLSVDRSDVAAVAWVGWAGSVDPQAAPVSATATRASRSAPIRPRRLRESGKWGVVFVFTGELYGPECNDVKPNQSSARDGSSDDDDRSDLPAPPLPLPPSNAGSIQSSARGGPAAQPPPTPAPPGIGMPPMPPPTSPDRISPVPPVEQTSRTGWRAALVTINVVAIVITAIAVTLLITGRDNDKVDTSQVLSETTTSARAATTSLGTSPVQTDATATTADRVAPAPSSAPVTSSSTRAQITVPPTTSPPPTEPPPPALPSAEDALSTAQSTIESFLSADSNNNIDEALGYLMEPLDMWVESSDQSLAQVREDIDGGKSDNTQLSIVGGVSLASGPTPSDLGEWEATVTYELQATGTYFSEKYGEQRCINNVQLIEDKIVGTSDGGGRIKSHKRVQELSNACKY